MALAPAASIGLPPHPPGGGFDHGDVHLDTGRELAGVAIAGEPDAIWYNADRARLYVAIGRPGVHTTAFDRARQLLYVFLPGTCRAAVYEDA